MASLSIRGLAVRYGATSVLDGVDLEVADGAYAILIGPSGCGKSTLLRAIAGLERPAAGTIHLGDRRVDALSPQARDVAMVCQSYALYPHMSVRRNLGFALEVRGLPRAEIDAAVEAVADQLGLRTLLDRLPAALSGGQRQRVAMGRAIVRRPAVFLFDEPLSNLDPALRADVRIELKKLHRRLGATFVHVTHDPVEALALSDQLVVLEGGRVAQSGPPRELYDAPTSAFVARFIGTPPMNLLPGLGDGHVARVDGWNRSFPTPLVGPVWVGVRPAECTLTPGSWGQVDAVEWMGAERVVTVVRPGFPPVAVQLRDRDVGIVEGGVDLSVERAVVLARL